MAPTYVETVCACCRASLQWVEKPNGVARKPRCFSCRLNRSSSVAGCSHRLAEREATA